MSPTIAVPLALRVSCVTPDGSLGALPAPTVEIEVVVAERSVVDVVAVTSDDYQAPPEGALEWLLSVVGIRVDAPIDRQPIAAQVEHARLLSRRLANSEMGERA